MRVIRRATHVHADALKIAANGWLRRIPLVCTCPDKGPVVTPIPCLPTQVADGPDLLSHRADRRLL